KTPSRYIFFSFSCAGEAKNLSSTRDCYCTVKLDQEEVYRTAVREKTQCPFWAEEYMFDIPIRFRMLSFYIYEKDKLKRSDSAIGKVALRRGELHKCQSKDQWYPLTPIDQDTEVQGKVHVEIRTSELLNGSSSITKLAVRVVEGSGLTIVNGQCDTYATVSYHSASRLETKRTKVKRKSTNPQFDEAFQFELQKNNSYVEKNHFSPPEEDICKTELRIALWNSVSGLSGDVFIGEVKIPISALDMSTGLHQAWYFLKPRETSNARHSKTVGSLRVRIEYQKDYVFPTSLYENLREILLTSPEVEPTTSSAVYILGEFVKEKITAARPLVRLFHHYGQILPIIRVLAEHEISTTTDPHTIFRGNSLASKCIDEFMRLQGLHYLHDVLKGVVDDIYEERKQCEIDTTKFKDGENLEANLANLQHYIEKAFQAIVGSAATCPTSMCEVFYYLKEAASRQFPDDPDAKYSAVSGFVFLRFFAPAILSPRLFHLKKENPDELVSRTLKMVSKAIQTLGNHVNPDKLSSVNMKEEYMTPLYSNILDREHVQGIRKFLEKVSSSKSKTKSMEAPVVLKEGYMIKRAQGRKRLGIGMKNFKRRWFRLTNRELTYSKSDDCLPLCTIPISDVLAVEKLEEESFQMKFMFQVVQPKRALYVQASNCVEEKAWIDILSNICKSNRHRLSYYHPAAFVNGHWMCCKLQNESDRGCTPVTGVVPWSVTLDIDPDREMERIYTLFKANIAKLEKLEDACALQAVYQGTRSEAPPMLVEDSKSCFETVKGLLYELQQIEESHVNYRTRREETREYGSKQTPIGDENFNNSFK
ncbi:ras GTPase-activating protein 3-like, partial [Lytechinus variegatus]|uniref:ras GTPase-activating protein 3-like n=1 Tax=Lytechinus variegatus TaxID=7654 RepID=UPI001BB13992